MRPGFDAPGSPEDEEAAAPEDLGLESGAETEDEEVAGALAVAAVVDDGGRHEPMRTTRASWGGKGPRHPPVAASQACDEPRIVATCDAVFFFVFVFLGWKGNEKMDEVEKSRKKKKKRRKKKNRKTHVAP